MRRRFVVVLIVLLGVAGLAGPLGLLVGADRGEASFGDAETFGLNRASAATVAIGVGETTLPVDTSLLAPGDRVDGRVEIVNEGTLPLRYAVVAERDRSTVVSLLDVLDWSIWAGSSDAGCSPVPAPGDLLFSGSMSTDQIVGDPAIGADTGDRSLDPGQVDVLCFEVVLPVGTDDAYQAADAIVRLVVAAEQATEGPS